jgi:WD40 repeat protein
VAFSPDGKRLASGSALARGEVKVWDAQTGQELLSRKGAGGKVAYSPDGKRLASAARDNTVKVWDAQTGQELLTYKGHTKSVLSVAFNADGKRLVSASDDNTVKVWDAQTGQELFSFKTGPTSGVAFSPDGKRLASAGGKWLGNRWDGAPGEVKVWDTQTGQELLTLKVNTGEHASLAFSPDGKRLASSSQPDGKIGLTGPGEVKVWDAQTGRELLTLKGHISAVNSVVFSPDGKRLVSSARWINGVKVWDAQTGQELLNLKVGGPVGSVAFSPNGHWLASGPEGGTVTVWDATPLPEKPKP